MTDFRQLSDTVWASPQITENDVARAAEQGFALIVNNRPDAEEPGQPDGATIAAAARAAGVGYAEIPVGHAGFSEPQIDAMDDALANAGPDAKVLAYCRSGTRSTFLWSLAQAKAGADPDDIATAAAGAGYDVAPIRPALDMLAARADN